MRTKDEFAPFADPELNVGNKYPGIESAITQAQNIMQTSITFPIRIVVHKKLYDYLRGNPWQFTITTDDTGLPTHQKGLVKISWV